MDEAAFGRVLADLLHRAHDTAPGDLAVLVRRAARAMGLTTAEVYLADLQEDHLVPLDGASGPEGGPAPLSVDGTLAGRVYRTQSAQPHTDHEQGLWLPLVDGVERIGVLHCTAERFDEADVGHCAALASLVALLVVSKSGFSDTLLRLVRARPMSLQAELAWAFMPPRTLGTAVVTSSAVLEPAYEIGGDAFDHALGEDGLHLTVVDAMGHDAASGLSAALALAGCRSRRRRGAPLAEIAAAVDGALRAWVPERILTAVFADLDVATGRLTWVNFGHPAPLLIRRQHVVPGALTRRAQLPLGLPAGYPPPRPVVHQADLEPGDRILVHTDGVTEAPSATGELFGEARLVDHVVRATAAGEPAPEALRRLIHAILAHQSGRLADDATILLAEWHPRS